MQTGVYSFRADWCLPCRTQSPIIDKLSAEYDIQVQAVDVDENEELRAKFAVRSVPTLIAIKNGEVVAELIGSKPEAQIRELFASLVQN